MADVFITSSHEDIQRALEVAWHLDDAGVDVWVDKTGIRSSPNWRHKVVQEMQACRVCVVLCSEASMRSRSVHAEIALADHLERSFLPIHLEKTEYPAAIQFSLVDANFIEAFNQPIEEWLPQVFEALRSAGVRVA